MGWGPWQYDACLVGDSTYIGSIFKGMHSVGRDGTRPRHWYRDNLTPDI